MQMVMMISGCDMVSSLAVSWSIPADDILCTWQAGLTAFFFRGSWIWSVFMVLTIWFYICRNEEFMSFQRMNVLSTGINLLFEFLPFSTGNRYGEDDDRLGRSICSFKAPKYVSGDTSQSNYVKDWILITHYGPVGICVLIMIGFLILTWRKVRTFDTGPGARIRRLVRKAALYPAIVLLSWLPNLICFCVAEFYFTTQRSRSVYYNHVYLPTRLTYCWASLSGLFISGTFFYNSKAARHCWYQYWMSAGGDDISLVQEFNQQTSNSVKSSDKSAADGRRSSINVLEEDMI